jgi:uncharacterized protein
MTEALAIAALSMGLLGGSHCAAMCAPMCTRPRLGAGSAQTTSIWWQFHVARMTAYATLGAIIATASQMLTWFSSHVHQAHRIAMLVPILCLCWGTTMLIFGKQPIWAQQPLQRFWKRLSKLTQGHPWAAGLAWVFMPCGMLYAALAMAALGNGPIEGGALMLLFSIGTTLWIAAAQHLWLRLRLWRGTWGLRLSGLALVLGSSMVLTQALVPSSMICGVK